MKVRYNYRIYPTQTQQANLACTFGCARYVWNEALAIMLNTDPEEDWPSRSEIRWMVTVQQKTLAAKSWLTDVSSVVLQESLRDLDVSLKNFFESLSGKRKGRKMGFPKPKRRSSVQSARFTKSAFKLRDNGKIYLAKIGDVKVNWSRDLPSPPSSVTVTKNAAGQYHVSFVVETEQRRVKPKRKSIGVDLGIKTFAFMSDGTKATAPDYRRLNRKVARTNRKLARQQKGSNGWNATKLKLAKLHLKVANIRKDFLHKLSTKLVRENQTVSLEDLNVSGMLKNRRLSRAISEQGWATLRTMCEAKAKQYAGRTVSIISRWEPTSQVCSDCGFRWGKLDLKVREIKCISCGTSHDRDENAAKNINKSGLDIARDSKRGTENACKSGHSSNAMAHPSQPYEATQLCLCF